MDNARVCQRRVSRRFLVPKNPIVAVVDQWCNECNRESFAVMRLGVGALAGVAAINVDRPWHWVFFAVVGTVGVSFFYYPLRALRRCFVEQQHEYVPDRLLLLVAESTDIDRDTKLEIAQLVAAKGAITYFDLREIAGREEMARSSMERAGGTGFRALTSLIAVKTDGDREQRH